MGAHYASALMRARGTPAAWRGFVVIPRVQRRAPNRLPRCLSLRRCRRDRLILQAPRAGSFRRALFAAGSFARGNALLKWLDAERGVRSRNHRCRRAAVSATVT